MKLKELIMTLIVLMMLVNVSNAERLKVGYIPQTGFLEEDRPGHYRGYGYEYMEFLSRYCDKEFEYMPCTTWKECGEKLQSGLIDLLPAMPGDYRTLENVTRTDHVIGRYPMELVTQEGTINSKMRIGTTPWNAPVPALPKIAEYERFEYELINFANFYDMEEAFKRRELDGYIAPMLEPDKEKNVASVFDRQSYRLLVRSDRKDLLNMMNLAMDEMLMDQPNIRNRLNYKYFRGSGAPLILNRQEKEYLERKGKLRTAILFQEKPYVYKRDNGELYGVIPSLIQQIATDLNIEIEIIKTETVTETEQLIKSGQIDFIADCVCDFSWAKTLNMLPTQSYLQLEYIPITKRGLKADDVKVVACVVDMLYTKNFVFKKFTEENRVYAETLVECLKLVNNGAADVVYIPRNEIQYMIDEANTYNLEIALESAFNDELSLGVSNKADNKLWRILDKEINHLDMNKLKASVNEHINSSSNKMTLQWMIYKHPVESLMIFVLIILIAVSPIIYRVLIRREQTKAIREKAYNDSRYGLPNATYFKEQAPIIYKNLETDENVYVLKFASYYKQDNNLMSDKKLRDAQLKDMATGIISRSWNLLTTIGDTSGSLFCIWKARNNSEIVKRAQEILHEFGYIQTNGSRIWINMKAGISRLENNDITKNVNNAKIACKWAREDVMLFDSNFEKKLEFEEQVESHMNEAIENSEFQAWYQNEYEIKTQKTVGYEAFIRWQSAELGFLLPEKFIGLFERNGFILSTDYFIFDEVCKLQRKRIDDKAEIVPISINQSSLHIMEEHYTEKIKSIYRKYKLPRGIVKLEFNERAFENILSDKRQVEHVDKIFKALQTLGIKITVDNFGRSYSSYKLLEHLPIDEIKINGDILHGAISSTRMKDILSTIIELCKKLKIRVTCEGVEEEEQEELLNKLGCRYAQGFLRSESSPLQ